MAFTGKKISDLTIVNSASANSRFTMVQDGQTVSSPVSALGCSLKDFTDVMRKPRKDWESLAGFAIDVKA